MDLRGGVKMIEAINEYYIDNGKLRKLEEWREEGEGKLIYEVIRIINGKPLFYKEHYDRMINSFKLNNYKNDITYDEVLNDINNLVKSNNKTLGNIKIIFNTKSNEFKIFFIKHSYPTDEMYKEGVKTILYFGERENPNAKVINNSFRGAVNKEIKKNDAHEAILVDRNGYITEGSRSNIFLIKGSNVYTSKVEAVLPGVTRTEIIKVAKENSINIIEENIRYTDLEKFDVLFISGTSPNILPIKRVNGLEFDVENDLLRKLMRLFDELICRNTLN